MIYEYALDPLLISDPICRLIVNGMGYSKGRLVSKFPSHWEDLIHIVLQDSDVLPIQRKRMIEIVNRLKDRMFPRDYVFDENDTWIENAIFEHNERPFRAILASSNPGRKSYVLCDDNIDENNPLWDVDTTVTIPRKSEMMAETARLLLESAKEVIFVDPHFSLEKRHSKPLEAFMSILSNRTADIRLRRIEYHIDNKIKASCFMDKLCAHIMPKLKLPKDLTMKIVRWEKHDELHNRYILTNKAGVSFHHGLDEGRGTDEVTILSEDSYKQRWKQFNRATCPFNFCDGFEVTSKSVKQINSSSWG